MPAIAIIIIAVVLIWLGIIFLSTELVSNKISISIILISIPLFIWVAIAYNHINYNKETLPIIEIKNDRYSYQMCITNNDEINLTKYFGRYINNAKMVTRLESENWVYGIYFTKDEKYVINWPLEKKE